MEVPVTKSRPNADDYAELLASMSIAIGLAVTKETPELGLENVLAQASRNMAGRYWQITAARKLHISPQMWMDRPWHCWQIRKLASELLDPAEDGPEMQAKVTKLGRYSAMVEFGVIVNESWYRRLRGAVVDGVTTHAELRALLRRPVVWCGAKQDGPSDFLVWVRGSLGFGRPPDGELLIEQSHPITRAFFMTVFLTSTLGAGLGMGMGMGMGMGLVFPFVSSPYFFHDRLLILIGFTVSMFLVSVASWWLGPSSTHAARRLDKIFNSPRM